MKYNNDEVKRTIKTKGNEKMKRTVIDLRTIEKDKKVDIFKNEKDFEDFTGFNFRTYYKLLKKYCIDEIDFDYKDIDKTIFIIDDGCAYIRIVREYDNDYYAVFWRSDTCHILRLDRSFVEDEDTICEIEYFEKRYVFGEEYDFDWE